MTRELTRVGNASSLHGSGRTARRVVEESREAIAARVGAHPTELIFTSGGTESDNLAVKGALWSGGGVGRRRVITSTIEHHAVLDSVAWLGRSGFAEVSYVPVDATGRLDLATLASAVDTDTSLVSVMWANNEVGTVQAIPEIAAIAADNGAICHSDAVQAVGHVDVDFAASGLDLLTFTAHKLGGPYGIGALVARRELRLAPLLHGGGQERDVRSGTRGCSGCRGLCCRSRGRLAASGAGGAASTGTACQLDQHGARRRAHCSSARANLRTRSPSRHRQHRLSGVLGRRDLDAAGLRGDRLFDWCGLLGRGCTAEPRAACHGIHRERCALRGAILPWPLLDRCRRRRSCGSTT